MRVSGVPYDRGRNPQGAFAGGLPNAGVLHRTYGAFGRDTYNGAYQVGKYGRAGLGIGFHFLIGKNEGQWVQFYDTTMKAAHAKGANDWAVGIEFDGVNEEGLTPWQLRCGAHILGALSEQIPLTYYSGARARVTGWLNHASVPHSTHTDMVTKRDFDMMLSLIRPAQPTPPTQPSQPPQTSFDITETDMYIAVDGIGFFAQIGNVTVPLPGMDLAGFAQLMSHPKSVGFITIPAAAAADFAAKVVKQTVAAQS